MTVRFLRYKIENRLRAVYRFPIPVAISKGVPKASEAGNPTS